MERNILNEDNKTGFHTGNVVTGSDRPVTGGNDAPIDVNLDQLKAAAKQAKETIMGKGTKVASGGSGSGDTYIYNDNRIFNNTDVDNAADGGSAVSDGLAWFGAHWKEAAIVAGAAAIIVAIAKLVKAMNKSLKVRYNKVVKTLQRAQKDFTLKPDGLNMKSVLPGVGSGIFDWVSRMWTANWKSKKNIRGNIGLHPFCAQYVAEIADDYRTATDAFSKIKLGSEGSEVDSERNTDTTVDQETNKAVDNISTSAYSGKVYNSFYEAYREDFLNEGVAEDKVNESVLAMISGGIALASLAARAGSFIYQRFKNGKPEGDPKKIQVTKESTREICYAIINNYADKYINMQQVWKELGISTESLADVSISDCDKLQTILKKYSKPEKNAYTKQYERIHKAYTTMLRHYYAIGDGIISNFVKYTEAKDEKHANLVVASKEKLQNMWDSQKDFYDNNFSHVIIEITSSEPYIKYLDFIIEKVIPVFKSGLASDADYVLDIVPKKGEYYLLRQTGNGQANVADQENVLGNVAIAQVISFDRESKNITFKLIGKLKDERSYNIYPDGTAYVNKNEIDYNAYKDQKDITLNYGKWMALDPTPMNSIWTPEAFTEVYFRQKDNEDQYIYGIGSYGDEGKFNKVVFVKTIKNSMEVKSAQIFELDNYLSFNDLDKFFTKTDEPFNMGFTSDENSPIKYYLSYYKYWKPEIEEVKTTEDMAKIINKKDESDQPEKIKAVSILYTRDSNVNGRDITEYAFAIIDNTDECELSGAKEKLNEADEDSSVNVIDPNTDDAKKNIVSIIMIGNVEKGSDIFSDIKDNKFDGSSINIDPACSIDQVDDKLKAMGFEKVEQDANKIKGVMLKNILAQSGNVRKASVGQYKIDDIDKAIEEMSKREGAAEKMDREAGRIADDIISKVNELNLQPNDQSFVKARFNSPDGGFVKGIGTRFLIKVNNRDKRFFVYDTNVKLDNGNDNIKIYLYPTVYSPSENNRKFREIPTDAKLGVIIYVTDKIFFFAPLDKNEIEKAIKNIVVALTGNGTIEKSRFIPAEADENGADSSTSADSSTRADSSVAQNQPDNNSMTITYSYDSQVSESSQKGSITSVSEELLQAAEKFMEVVKIEQHEDDVHEYVWWYKIGDFNNVRKWITRLENYKDKLCWRFNNIKISKSFKDVDFYISIEGTKLKIFAKGVDITGKFFDSADNSSCSEMKCYDYYKMNVEKFAEQLMWAVKKLEQLKTNESISVTYSYDSQVSESSQNGSITNITRKFSEKKRNWYVLSEAVYDDGSNKVSKLDDPKFVSKLNERYDCTSFAKSSRLAKFMKFESTQNYQLVSENNYTPSLATPLYESVLIVKIDKMDNVTEKVYLGKFKING